MTAQQESLLDQARASLAAAKLLRASGFDGFAASRAYYAMFYVAQALLLGKGLTFSKHAGVVSAFGEHFAKTRDLPPEFHRYLIRGMEVRHAGDYAGPAAVTSQEADEQIARAEEFLQSASQLLAKGT